MSRFRGRSLVHVTSGKSIPSEGGGAMILREILQSKGSAVHTIGSGATLETVVQTLVAHNCGSLVVCDHDARDRQPGGKPLAGIITERDILKACVARNGSLSELRVSDIMSRTVTTGTPDDSVEDTMGLMTQLRIRHLPILEDGKLVGLVSIGDVVKMQHDQLTMENHYLKSYLHG